MSKTFPILYSKGKKGEIRTWVICTEGPDIVTEHGVHQGKVQVSRKTAKGKNLGRRNETTPEQQALLQAESMWKKQLDKGYFDSIEKAQSMEVFLPMLASSFEEKKRKMSYPCCAQPKLDGVRCLAFWEDGKVKLMSRGGKPYSIEHIAQACEKVLDKDQVFDGEIYIHGTPLQDINSLVKKPQEASVGLEYWIYDTFYRAHLNLPWKVRLTELEVIYKLEGFLESPLKKVPWGMISEESLVRKAEHYWVEQGYEGAILRDMEAPYEIGKRSNFLQKVKSFLDEEFPIVDFKEGEGKFKGCVIWECLTPEGKRFHVTPKGTMAQRALLFQTGPEHLGKYLKVQFFQYTNDKIPQFPVGLGFRLEEDM